MAGPQSIAQALVFAGCAARSMPSVRTQRSYVAAVGRVAKLLFAHRDPLIGEAKEALREFSGP